MDVILTVITIVTFFTGVVLWARSSEKKAFNGGFCPGCGRQWRRYSMDSGGARGYTCDICNKGVWVSYWGIDNDFHA